jgi:DNA-binding beta-propeller fold protein YncE
MTHLPWISRWVVVIALLGSGTLAQDRNQRTQVLGKDRLVSVQPLPDMDGPMCENPGAEPALIASLEQNNLIPAFQPQRSETGAVIPARPSDAVRSEVAKRPPLSTIRDPRNTFAGLAVDPVRNEVIMAEENNFSILVYDRMENTPPRAALTEPKRTIQGEKTYLEFACAVYVDPPTGDIYGINNDTLSWMTVFNRNAKGNVAPNRKLKTPGTTFGIVGDEEAQELLMTVQDPDAVVTFKKSSSGQEPPIRLLQGSRTQMADPHGIALDAKTGLIYVTNWGTYKERRIPNPAEKTGGRGGEKPNWPVGIEFNIAGSSEFRLPSITVYRKDANGDTAPLRIIQGPKTLMNWPTAIAVHPDRGEIFVANDTADNVTVYRADASGDVAPIRVLKGPRSLIKNPTGIAVDVKNGELWVTNFGSHSATVFPIDASGDPAPKRVIRTGPANAPSPMISNPHTIAYDTKRDELLVSN